MTEFNMMQYYKIQDHIVNIYNIVKYIIKYNII